MTNMIHLLTKSPFGPSAGAESYCFRDWGGRGMQKNTYTQFVYFPFQFILCQGDRLAMFLRVAGWFGRYIHTSIVDFLDLFF